MGIPISDNCPLSNRDTISHKYDYAQPNTTQLYDQSSTARSSAAALSNVHIVPVHYIAQDNELPQRLVSRLVIFVKFQH